MQISEVVVRDIQTADADTPLLELARRMREHGIGFLPIVEAERLVGVITDRDIVLRAVSESKDSEKARARDVMSLEVVCCFEDDTVEHAKELMVEHNVRRLPVIDHQHRLIGVIRLSALEGQSGPIKKAVKVTYSYGRPHKVAVKTVYITGVKNKKEAEAAAVKRVEEEQGGAWTNLADGLEATEEPDGPNR